MGITTSSLCAILYARDNGVDFAETLTIGRQTCFMRQWEIDNIFKNYDPLYSRNESQNLREMLNESRVNGEGPCFAEGLLKYLGAESVESVDYSDYEGASFLHDMNAPITDVLKNRFSVVLDAGTLEHVFNFPVAIRNCMDAVKVGGHLMLLTPANNFFGHGFYQFSPELFYSLLSEENGYADTRIFTQNDRAVWYEIVAPQKIKKRVDLCCAKETPALLTVISQKIKEVPENLQVLQSDYVEIWDSHGAEKGAVKLPLPVRLYRKIPESARKAISPFLGRAVQAIRGIRTTNKRIYDAKMREFYLPCDKFLFKGGTGRLNGAKRQ